MLKILTHAFPLQAKMSLGQNAPRLNAFGNYEFNDPKFFGFNANNWTVWLSLQWEVFKGFQDVGNVQKSRAELTLARANAEKHEHQSRVEFLTA